MCIGCRRSICRHLFNSVIKFEKSHISYTCRDILILSAKRVRMSIVFGDLHFIF